MMASSSSSNLSDHLVQDGLPAWPSSSSLPFAPAPHSAVIIGGNHQWSQQPLTLNCADHHYSNELEVLLSAQGHSSHHAAASPLLLPHHQLSSLLMMQDLGFQWSNCSFPDTSSMPMMNGQQQGGHNNKTIKEEQPLKSRSSSCTAGTAAMSYRDVVDGGGGGGLPVMAAAGLDRAVLPSVNISRPVQKAVTWPAAPPPPLAGDAFEILASSRLCKTLLQASPVMLHNGMPLLRSEHVPYGPPAAHLQGPSSDNYREMGAAALVDGTAGGGRHWSAEHDAACEKAARPAVVPSSQAPPPKKPRVESRSSTIVPSFKVRKEKLGDRIAALQQLVSPFGKTDTASVLMEAIGYIKFLQDQVETLSGPYLKSSRNKKPRTAERGASNANGGEQEETKLDLRSRGLCLVPLSCTSYVTNDWAPPNFR
ncbi:hypothetical protein HU200_009675 [Digitaria exilis]|uniref:BHLH domain-containing protein n=1 Tax=Digitaria exilis TaxID=1010633 RepID=A0A835KMT1_9POAL|nr:hypothetical protein HU200_009675 [Digitaria exilis]CAB3476622.1 unnamed protein product [Digitaria exilis]